RVPPDSHLFPYTPLFRSLTQVVGGEWHPSCRQVIDVMERRRAVRCVEQHALEKTAEGAPVYGIGTGRHQQAGGQCRLVVGTKRAACPRHHQVQLDDRVVENALCRFRIRYGDIKNAARDARDVRDAGLRRKARAVIGLGKTLRGSHRVTLGKTGKAPGAGGTADQVQRCLPVTKELAEQVLVEAVKAEPLGATAGADQHRHILLLQAVLAQVLRGARAGHQSQGAHRAQRTSMPGWAPLSGLSRKISSPPGPAASTMPSDRPNFILRGARLATSTTSLSFSCSGAYLLLMPANTLRVSLLPTSSVSCSSLSAPS